MAPISPNLQDVAPVPSEWLDMQQVESSRLDRLCGDAELAGRLRDARYQGRDWDYFVVELIKYGYAVLVGWMRTGLIWRRLREHNIGGLPTPPAQAWDDEAWNELAGMTMVIAVEKFRDYVLMPGRWDPRRGASLKTFFIGQCLFRFPNVYRSWHTAAAAHQREIADNLQPWRHQTATTAGPERQLIDRDEIHRGLAGLDDRTRHALVLLEQGFDQTEVAERLGTTRKSVEMLLRRHRNRQQQRKGRHG